MRKLGKFNLKNQTDKLKNLSTRVFRSTSLVVSQSTPYHVIFEYEHAKVRHYPALERQFLEPLVFIPPLAVTVSIYDLYPYRSLVNYFQQQGFEVYLLDWGRLNYSHHKLDFMSFLDDTIPNCLEKIREHSGSQEVSLHGWSMGGLFATLYTAHSQSEKIKNLITLGAPIDTFLTGWHGELLKNTQKILKRYPRLAETLYTGKLPKKVIQTPGKLNAFVFKLLDPKGWLNGHKRFLQNLNDAQAVQEHATMGAYLNDMIDYPGGINQDMMLNIWLQNPLKNGHIHLNNKLIDLKNIHCNLLVGAGLRDQLVAAEAVSPLCELTNSPDVTFTLIPGGHMGIMSNQNTAKEFWPNMACWLTQRSTHI
jgi:poly(3-hydroxyalkanoate) synthetase